MCHLLYILHQHGDIRHGTLEVLAQLDGVKENMFIQAVECLVTLEAQAGRIALKHQQAAA